MRLTPDDVLCCPPPLFHCFGLVLGLLAVVTHGAKIVFPNEIFDPSAVLRAIVEEKCTAVHGVPAMFDSILGLPEAKSLSASNLNLRTGIVAGAPVPRYLMELMVSRLGMSEFTSSYGLTEASPTCFNAFTDDPISKRLTTVGTLMPHARAKIVDKDGNTVPIGTRGELWIGGYQLQAGYWNNSEKTAEVMSKDEMGARWLHTGDEAVFDDKGYCTITGRFKDIIIRGKMQSARHMGGRISPPLRAPFTDKTKQKKEARTYTRSRSRSAWWHTQQSVSPWWLGSATPTTARRWRRSSRSRATAPGHRPRSCASG